MSDGISSHAPIVLLVEDEQTYRNELSAYLASYGFAVDPVDPPSRVVAQAMTSRPHAVILDHRLGEVDGLDLLRQLREVSDVPCIVLTGNVDETDRILGLEYGADDHILKTAKPREILARLRAVLRRARPAGLPAAAPAAEGGAWRLALDTRDLFGPDGTIVPLTSAEFDLLAHLAGAPGRVISREELCRVVFRRPFTATDRAIDNLVVRLRKKLGDNPATPRVIKTVRPIGYMFTAFP